ncbi:anthranilate phosphoribosyltransferase [Sinanaerobacter chloroacetimidivorans]|uniref:Anthranilate phosphoribosyltransferase n=1 Tax=Sinanaerobacter chloroacetimidivorans TaxID=2818044 RepID=A0A8J8B340_9FIRM|nr:anthranilate phosphoribosyltransferase [Sinanaerobacter chloroacetimidivorans]MBR0599979.1 anthranilate phosphoribosyltransferase [Sinanaerobacter chloroacetimidivorans]
MITEAIYQAISGEDLEYNTAKMAMEEIMEGRATQAQIAAFLTALRMKGESISEITACAAVMREKALRIQPGFDVMDIVGTGGDEAGTFNISTTTAFVVSAGGIPVAKHGNRGVSSRSGAADVLEKLGVNINLTPEQSGRLLDEIGLCFMFAQAYHSSMKYAAPVRREIGIRTIFNVLGPLSNPAGANLQIMGVYDEKLVEPLAQVLSNLGVKRGLVIHGSDGLDEATLTGETKVMEIDNGNLKSYRILPEEIGFRPCRPEDLLGGDAADNAEITLNILKAKEKGAKRDIIVLNAAMAFYIAGKGDSIKTCIPLAEMLLDSGAAFNQLEKFMTLSNGVLS